MGTAKTSERGYGAEHQAERERWQHQLDAGQTVRCACNRPDCPYHDGRCPVMITAETAWDLGHTDDRTGWTGPECRPCNRSAGTRKAQGDGQMIIREW